MGVVMTSSLNFGSFQAFSQFLEPINEFGVANQKRLRIIGNDKDHYELKVCKRRGIFGRIGLFCIGKKNKDRNETVATFTRLFNECHDLADQLDFQSQNDQEDIKKIEEVLKCLSLAVQRVQGSKVYPQIQKEYLKVHSKLTKIACEILKNVDQVPTELNKQIFNQARDFLKAQKQKEAIKDEIEKLDKENEKVQAELENNQCLLDAEEGEDPDTVLGKLYCEYEEKFKQEVSEAQKRALKIKTDAQVKIKGEPEWKKPSKKVKRPPIVAILTGRMLNRVILCKDGEEIYVNDKVLAQVLKLADAKSRQAEMLHTCKDKVKRPVIDLSGTSGYFKAVVEAFWMYCQDSDKLHIRAGNLAELLRFAKEYELKNLEDACCRSIKRVISNSEKAMLWYDQVDDEGIIKHCQQLFMIDLNKPVVRQFLLEQTFTKEQLYYLLFESAVPVLFDHEMIARFLIDWAQVQSKVKSGVKEDDFCEDSSLAELPSAKDKGKEKVRLDDQSVDGTERKRGKSLCSIDALLEPISEAIPFSLWAFIRIEEDKMASILEDLPEFNLPKKCNQFGKHFAPGSKILESTTTVGCYTDVIFRIPMPQDPQNPHDFYSPPFYILQDRKDKHIRCYQLFMIWNLHSQSYVCGIRKFGEKISDDLLKQQGQLSDKIMSKTFLANGKPINKSNLDVSLMINNQQNMLKTNRFYLNSCEILSKYGGWSLSQMQYFSKNNIFEFDFRFRG